MQLSSEPGAAFVDDPCDDTDSLSSDHHPALRPASRFRATDYSHTFRRYQLLALEAFETARAEGQRQIHLVSPPGSGKTVLGLEAARRLGRRTLVLCPNTAIQGQWLRQWRDFQPATATAGSVAAEEPDLLVLTYQAIANLGSDQALEEQAERLWQASQDDSESWDDQPADREALRGHRARARRLVAAGDQARLLELLRPEARRLLTAMQASGPWTLVLDECHHLISTWGYVARAFARELGAETMVLALTATPPIEISTAERSLYLDLLGPPDFQVPTPAVVKEGDLAPYQELAYFVEPLPHELEYLNAQHERFQQLLLRLLDVDFASLSFVEWVQDRIVKRSNRDGVVVSWQRFERDRPALAQAGLRFLQHNHLALPEAIRMSERYRQPPSADDWVELIEDFCLHVLKGSADPRDERAWQEIGVAMRSLGYLLTRGGVRRHAATVDRVLALSAAKDLAAREILRQELAALGPRLRALVLCDYERSTVEPSPDLQAVLAAQAGSALRVAASLAGDPASAELNPVLVTGRTLACAPEFAPTLLAALGEREPRLAGTLQVERAEALFGDLALISSSGGPWGVRLYLPLVTELFEAGLTRCLIGTRALLGEGWDASSANVLLDLCAASTSITVHQTRGRTIRRDRDWAQKVANNWDVVCVAPEHPKGFNDYARFVRKHQNYYALTEDGAIESGVSHVHPALSPFGPPARSELSAINERLLLRAGEREAVYQRWQVGQSYENLELAALIVRWRYQPGLARLAAPTAIDGSGTSSTQPSLERRARWAVPLGIVGLLTLALEIGWPFGFALAGLLALLTLVGVAWWLGGRAAVEPSGALELLAAAVADGLAATGGVRPDLGASAVRIAVRADGYYRAGLHGANLEESRRFTSALEELLAPLDRPRYLIARPIHEPPHGPLDRIRLAARLTSGRFSREAYHAVPSYLAANRARAGAFHQAWRQQVGPGRLLAATDPRAQAILELNRGLDPFAVQAQLRTVWE
jgi:superfamily II DNA or RNA helicase